MKKIITSIKTTIVAAGAFHYNACRPTPRQHLGKNGAPVARISAGGDTHHHRPGCVYLASDTIWMRPFVVDAATHRQADANRYVYVGFSTPTGELVKRVKLLKARRAGLPAISPADRTARGDIHPERLHHIHAQYRTGVLLPKGSKSAQPYALREGFDIKEPGQQPHDRRAQKHRQPHEDKSRRRGTHHQEK